MSGRRIHVRVSPTGEVNVEALGFQGSGCEAATMAIEEALGTVRQRTRKPDFWRRVLRLNRPDQQTLGEGGPTP